MDFFKSYKVFLSRIIMALLAHEYNLFKPGLI